MGDPQALPAAGAPNLMQTVETRWEIILLCSCTCHVFMIKEPSSLCYIKFFVEKWYCRICRLSDIELSQKYKFGTFVVVLLEYIYFVVLWNVLNVANGTNKLPSNLLLEYVFINGCTNEFQNILGRSTLLEPCLLENYIHWIETMHGYQCKYLEISSI